MLKYYCAITGTDFELLKDNSPESKKKVTVLANSMMVPVVMWMLTGALLSHEVMGLGWIVSNFVGLIFSGLIFMIEKQIVMSNGGWKMNTLRVVLGLCFAAIGSIAIDEVVFKKDIDIQVEKNYDAHINLAIDELEARAKEKKEELFNAQNERHFLWRAALEEAQGEADGTRGSKVRGMNTITKLKMQNAERLEQNYLAARTEYLKYTSDFDAEKQAKMQQLDSSYSRHSLLVRVKAMFDLVRSDGSMRFFYVLFSLILFIMEFSVIIAKYSQPETTYDKKVALIEKIGALKIEKLTQTGISAFDPGHYHDGLKKGYSLVSRKSPSAYSIKS